MATGMLLLWFAVSIFWNIDLAFTSVVAGSVVVTLAPRTSAKGEVPICATVVQGSHFPVIAERFHSHDGQMLKCYVIGQQVYTRHKPSIQDVSLDVAQNDGSHIRVGAHLVACNAPGVVSFNSLKSLPGREHIDTGAAQSLDISQEAVQACADMIRQCLGLLLFGFDLILPNESPDTPLLIDVNAFPSYKGIQGAADALRCVAKAVVQNARDCKT